MDRTDACLTLLALAAAAGSALCLYAASRHCRWTRLRAARGARAAGFAAALVSLGAWIAVCGAGAGLCAMLASWMLALCAVPYLALASTGGVYAEDD